MNIVGATLAVAQNKKVGGLGKTILRGLLKIKGRGQASPLQYYTGWK